MKTPVVIKYGGAALEVPAAAEKFAAGVVSLCSEGFQPIVVHGGGKALSQWMTRVGLTPRFVAGLRYTDAQTVEVATMVLCGSVNRQLVQMVQRAGGRAVGIATNDGNMAVAQRIAGAAGEDLGFVGELAVHDLSLLRQLLEAQMIPIFSSIGWDTDGQAFNCNADHVAAALAGAFPVADLLLLTDVDGVQRGRKRLARLTTAEVEDLLSSADVSGGMRPKLRYAIEALQAGVGRVHILNAGAIECLRDVLVGRADYGTIIIAS